MKFTIGLKKIVQKHKKSQTLNKDKLNEKTGLFFLMNKRIMVTNRRNNKVASHKGQFLFHACGIIVYQFIKLKFKQLIPFFNVKTIVAVFENA